MFIDSHTLTMSTGTYCCSCIRFAVMISSSYFEDNSMDIISSHTPVFFFTEN